MADSSPSEASSSISLQPSEVAPPPAGEDAKVLLLDFRNGETVSQHPRVAPLLSEGWYIQRAVPRVVEEDGHKLLVVLSRSGSASKAGIMSHRPAAE